MTPKKFSRTRLGALCERVQQDELTSGGVQQERMRACGEDVRELLHDGCPTACAGEAAFAYVDAFKAHVNVGFYQGASLVDPAGLLQGAGKRMRHVKIRWGEPVDADAVNALIAAAYRDMRARQGLST